jgi:predicted DNA-binding antitoxin AbrB/MazE fold protein
MTTAVKAIYEDGVFKPQEPVDLKEKTEVQVLIPEQIKPDADDPTGWKTIDRLIGIAKGPPTDASERHDEYLYDDPSD